MTFAEEDSSLSVFVVAKKITTITKIQMQVSLPAKAFTMFADKEKNMCRNLSLKMNFLHELLDHQFILIFVLATIIG